MATANVRGDSLRANITVQDIHQIAAALKRLNHIEATPVLSADDRLEIARSKRVCWSVLGTVTETLISLLDATAGDPDLEDGTGAEDAFEDHEERSGYRGPGCDIADAGEDNCDREAIDEREPEDGI